MSARKSKRKLERRIAALQAAAERDVAAAWDAAARELLVPTYHNINYLLHGFAEIEKKTEAKRIDMFFFALLILGIWYVGLDI